MQTTVSMECVTKARVDVHSYTYVNKNLEISNIFANYYEYTISKLL